MNKIYAHGLSLQFFSPDNKTPYFEQVKDLVDSINKILADSDNEQLIKVIDPAEDPQLVSINVSTENTSEEGNVVQPGDLAISDSLRALMIDEINRQNEIGICPGTLGTLLERLNTTVPEPEDNDVLIQEINRLISWHGGATWLEDLIDMV